MIKNKYIITGKNINPKENISSFINNNDFNIIMSLFSRMLKANQWKDYSFSLQKEDIIFCFYKHSFETPVYKIVYEKRSNNFSFRAGYYSEESSIINRDNSHSGISFGIGLDFKNGSVLGLSIISSDSNRINSLSASGINDVFLANAKRTSITASYNFKL